MKKYLLLFNTIKFLKWQQLYFRFLRMLHTPRVTDAYRNTSPLRSSSWAHLPLYPEKISSTLEARFLNKTKLLEFPDGWNSSDDSKLWLYNLHYFEDLMSSNCESKKRFHSELLLRWVDENPVGFGNGWEPYPTSLRIVNVLKAWLGGLDVPAKVFESVHMQASYLSNDLEKHLLGNHYFVNLKALLFASVIFGNSAWKKIAIEGLVEQIPEQILDDGSNFELTPMYHSLMLVDFLDMYNLACAYPEAVSERLLLQLKGEIPKMLGFMDVMSHPDGELSFFNDSAIGIAPPTLKIREYAQVLGVLNPQYNPNQLKGRVSGYLSVADHNAKLLFDAAEVGPSYIPGHAHADTLSFELSIGQERVIVNSGTSEYGLSAERLRQRSTLAHNTVEVDGKNSSQVWSGFRVANRACVLAREVVRAEDGSVTLFAKHNGYKSLFNGCVHERKLVLSSGRLQLCDRLNGKFSIARSRIHFHPALEVKLAEGRLYVKGQSFELTACLAGKRAKLLPATWHPEFGVSQNSFVLDVEFESADLQLDFHWSAS